MVAEMYLSGYNFLKLGKISFIGYPSFFNKLLCYITHNRMNLKKELKNKKISFTIKSQIIIIENKKYLC